VGADGVSWFLRGPWGMMVRAGPCKCALLACPRRTLACFWHRACETASYPHAPRAEQLHRSASTSQAWPRTGGATTQIAREQAACLAAHPTHCSRALGAGDGRTRGSARAAQGGHAQVRHRARCRPLRDGARCSARCSASAAVPTAAVDAKRGVACTGRGSSL
jgi:hypothetical protein